MNNNQKLSSNPGREHWGSKIGFIMAAAGSAIGLGNVWKFPYITGTNGGAAFVLVYLMFIAFIGLPIMLAEFTIGRKGQKDAIGSFEVITPNKPAWKGIGLLACVAAFMVLSFYSVVAGWTFSYIFKAGSGALLGADSAALGEVFGNFISNPYQPLLWHGFIMLFAILIVMGGIKAGIERTVKILMPALLVMLAILMIRALTLDGAWAGVEFFLKPDFGLLTAKGVLEALGHAFFTLSLGMGAMITYGSYLNKKSNMPSAALHVSLADTAIAFMAGLIIFPTVFALGGEPGAGPGLVFVTLPALFNAMPLGQIFATLFFVLLFVAALTSVISLLEVQVAYMVDEKKWARKTSAFIMGTAIFAMGVPASLSLGVWSDYTIFGKNFFDLIDFVASNILLPLGGLLTAIYVGWIWETGKVIREVNNDGNLVFDLAKVWIFCLRYLAPVAIMIVLLNATGLLHWGINLFGLEDVIKL